MKRVVLIRMKIFFLKEKRKIKKKRMRLLRGLLNIKFSLFRYSVEQRDDL